MSLVNKYLDETPLTSTKNKYVEGNLKYFEKSLKDLIYGTYGYVNLKRKTAPGAQLFTDFSMKSLLTSTESKFLPHNEPSRKKKKTRARKKYSAVPGNEPSRKKKKTRARKKCSAVPGNLKTFADAHNIRELSDFQCYRDSEGGHIESVCPPGPVIRPMDLSCPDGAPFGSERSDGYDSDERSRSGERSVGPALHACSGSTLFGSVPSALFSSAFPGNKGFSFGSEPHHSHLRIKGKGTSAGKSFGFGAAASPNIAHFKAPAGKRFAFGAVASPNMQQFQAQAGKSFAFGAVASPNMQQFQAQDQFQAPAMPVNIPETVILKMPSYELNVLTIQEKIDYNIFESHPVDSSKLHEKSTFNFKAKKLQFLNVVSMALVYSSNFKDNDDAYRNILQNITNEVIVFDPEFILKVALYARQELHIRTVTNFLLSYAAVNPSTRLYLEKYFKASIVLPSDWIQVAEFYQVLMNKPDKQSLPGALRRVMKKTFAVFDEYQLAKYNKNKKKQKKVENENLVMMIDGDDDERQAEDVAPCMKTFTLKNLIKLLHITSPVDHVMCLLGKKYPESHESFALSGLSGNWDPTKAGKRMKLPIPETWETQISAHGNKPSVWESLIEKNKLPYMATIRNLKNLVLSGISPKHQKKVIKYIENKNAVINSRQLPMQFYEAYKALSHLEDMIIENKSGVDDASDKKDIPSWKRDQIAKTKEKIKNVSVSVVEEYKSAITKALDISSLNNLHPIPGKTLVICEMPPRQKDKKINVKAIETCIMMGLMCAKACEECKMIVLCCTDTFKLKHDDDGSFLNIMMDNCERIKKIHSHMSTSDYEEYSDFNISALQNLLDSYLKPQKMLSLKLDHIVFLHMASDNASDRMKDAMSSFLQKYRQIVNSDLLYTDVDFSLSSKSFLETSVSEKDAYLCGSTSSLIKFIAQRSGGGQLGCVENIDQKFNLPEITESKKAGCKITCNFPTEIVMPLQFKVPKWHTVRIFISSTFKDMISERDMLIRYVFPELRRRAASIFVRVAEIDLRWGITEADSASKRAAELCLNEAQKSDLFVGFIGERYGTIYSFDPPDAPELQWVKDCPSGLSITELEMYAAALRDPESSCKKAFFYFRHNSFIRHVPQKWCNHFATEDTNSKAKVDQLKSKIKSSGLRVFDGYPCHWAGIFENKPILAGLDVLGVRVLENLWEAIQDIHKADPFENDISEEEMYQQNLIDSLTSFVGKKNLPLDAILKRIKSEHGIFVISGASGCGKTAFFINLLQNISSPVVVKFFIGVSPRSRDLSYMIQYICNSICHQLSVSIPLPDFSEDIVNQFPDFLVEVANSSGGRDVVLLMDGLDHLEPNDQRLDWLPLSLPNRIKLICSATDTSQAFNVLCERQVRGNTIFFETISPLQQSDRGQIVRNHLDHYRKTLDESAFNNHLLKIVTKKDSVNPLYLRIVCDFLRIYASFDNLITVLQKLPSTVTLLFQEIILQMENEFGASLVQTVLSLLCISKLGLEDNDLHYIISFVISASSQKIVSFDELKENILLLEPENLLSQVKYCSLIHVINIFAFGQFRQSSFTLIGTEFEYAVKKFYVNKSYISNCKYLHSVLAAYYHRMCDINKDEKYSGQSGFAIRALLYHLFQGCLYKELCDLLCTHQFIEAVFRTKVDDQLLEYYSLLLFDILETRQKISKEISYTNLTSFYDFVSRNFHIFHRYPQLVKQQALNESSNSLVHLKSEDLNYSSLENLCRSEVLDCRLATLCGFNKNITASAGEMQKPFVILGSEDGYLKVLDLSTRKIIHTIKSHFSAITCICYAGKNRVCASSVDGTLSLWDSQDFSRVAILKGHRHNATSCCADPSGCTLFSSGWDNSVRLWSMKDGRSISVIDDFKCPVSCIDHHPIKQQIACGLWNGNIDIWDTISMERKHVFQNASGSVKSIAYTPDGINIIASFMQSEISILSSEEGLKMSSLKGHILPVKALTYSYDPNIFISGSDDCTLKVWSSVSRSNFSSIDECRFCPISLMEFMSQNLLAIAFQNSEIWITDINCGKATAKFNLAPDIVSCFSKYSAVDVENQDFINDLFEKSLIFGAQSGKLMIGNLLSSLITVRVEMKSKITALLHNYDIILCGCADGDLGIFSYSGELLSKIVPGAHRGFITTFSVASREDQFIVLSTSNDNVLKLWDVKKSSLDVSLEAEFINKHKDTITCSVFQEPVYDYDQVSFWMEYVFTGSHDNNIISWDERSEEVFQGLKSSVLNVAYLKDYVIGCANDGAVVIWSQSGTILTSIPGIELSSSTLTFNISEDYSNGFMVTLAYVDTDGSVKISKPLEKAFCYSLEGHSKPITSCCAAKNGEIVSCSLDGSVNLWRMPAAVSENHPLHSSAVTGIIISSSYEFVLSSDVHGNLILWKIDLLSPTLPLIYAAKKNYPGGFIRGLSWLKNNRFVCAVSQLVDSLEKYFLNTFSLKSNSESENTSFSFQVTKSYQFESEILCFDTCPSTDVIVVGLKSGYIMVINSEKQQLKKMSDDWLLGVSLFTRQKTSDYFCASYVDGRVKLFSIADFLDSKIESVSPFAVYEPPNTFDNTKFLSVICCGIDRFICCGDLEGTLRVYHKHSLEFSEKVHKNSITGICILGPYIFTSSLDKTVKGWSLASHKQVCQFHSHVSITCLAAPKIDFDATNSSDYILVLGTSSGEVHLLKFHSK